MAENESSVGTPLQSKRTSQYIPLSSTKKVLGPPLVRKNDGDAAWHPCTTAACHAANSAPQHTLRRLRWGAEESAHLRQQPADTIAGACLSPSSSFHAWPNSLTQIPDEQADELCMAMTSELQLKSSAKPAVPDSTTAAVDAGKILKLHRSSIIMHAFMQARCIRRGKALQPSRRRLLASLPLTRRPRWAASRYSHLFERIGRFSRPWGVPR